MVSRPDFYYHQIIVEEEARVRQGRSKGFIESTEGKKKNKWSIGLQKGTRVHWNLRRGKMETIADWKQEVLEDQRWRT